MNAYAAGQAVVREIEVFHPRRGQALPALWVSARDARPLTAVEPSSSTIRPPERVLCCSPLPPGRVLPLSVRRVSLTSDRVLHNRLRYTKHTWGRCSRTTTLYVPADARLFVELDERQAICHFQAGRVPADSHGGHALSPS